MSENINNSGPQKINYDLKLFSDSLLPSALSGIFAVIVSLFAIGSIVFITSYQGSSFQQDVLQFQNQSDSEIIVDDYQDITNNFEQNVIIDRAPVMVFWMFVGALVYFMLTGILDAFSSAKKLEEELHFVHAKRKELLKMVYIKTALRLAILAIWLGYIMLFIKIILPYSLAAAHVGSSNILSISGIIWTVVALLILIIGIHIHVVLLRLAALRPRLFSQETSF